MIIQIFHPRSSLRFTSRSYKVKWSRYRPGVGQRVGRGIALLFHDRGTRRGWVVSSRPRPHFTPGKDPIPILQEAGWTLGPVWRGGKWNNLLHRTYILLQNNKSVVIHIFHPISSLHFNLFPFTSHHFTSLHFPSLHFNALHYTSVIIFRFPALLYVPSPPFKNPSLFITYNYFLNHLSKNIG